jgi:hypothetical protein
LKSAKESKVTENAKSVATKGDDSQPSGSTRSGKEIPMEISYSTEPERNPQSKLTVASENPEVSTFKRKISSPAAKQVLNMSPAFGASISQSNLLQLIRDIFSQEYDSQNVNMLYRQRQSRDDFSLAERDIGIKSGLPVRVF